MLNSRSAQTYERETSKGLEVRPSGFGKGWTHRKGKEEVGGRVCFRDNMISWFPPRYYWPINGDDSQYPKNPSIHPSTYLFSRIILCLPSIKYKLPAPPQSESNHSNPKSTPNRQPFFSPRFPHDFRYYHLHLLDLTTQESGCDSFKVLLPSLSFSSPPLV